MPASVAVISKGAVVEIKASRIKSGRLRDAEMVLDYSDEGTHTSRMAGQLVFTGHLRPPYARGVPGTSIRRLNAAPGGDRSLPIGKNGILNGDVLLRKTRVGWPAFEASTDSLTFFAAAVAFQDDLSEGSRALNASMPAENAWQRVPGPFNGDLDPGFNIIRLHEDDNVTYDCYSRVFDDADMDLYVRRGGVSENLPINAGDMGQIPDDAGYLGTFVKFDILLVDNAIIEQDVQLDYFLPYPSDVTLPLDVTGFNENNCPAKGSLDVPSQTPLHKYWNLGINPEAE